TIRKKPLPRGCSSLSIKSTRAHCAPWRKVGPKPDYPRQERTTFLRIVIPLRDVCLSMIFIGEPVSTSPDHASKARSKYKNPQLIPGGLNGPGTSSALRRP